MRTEDNIRNLIFRLYNHYESPETDLSSGIRYYGRNMVLLNSKKAKKAKKIYGDSNLEKTIAIIDLYKDIKIDKVISSNNGFVELHHAIPWVYPYSIITGIFLVVFGIYKSLLNDIDIFPYVLGGLSITLVSLIGILEIIVKRRELNIIKRI